LGAALVGAVSLGVLVFAVYGDGRLVIRVLFHCIPW